ncbi:hypothetical protein cyc_01965 [Cyclospora cayetanensis]|uniref:Uncharacterized protein n=1 Tax=Cyclospora cayetanensis TaxID=88456 RepID=A0A1D3D308_9EIME|nr:hypothetical protein cyc_01965 [Cyclospora cayetanensis]
MPSSLKTSLFCILLFALVTTSAAEQQLVDQEAPKVGEGRGQIREAPPLSAEFQNVKQHPNNNKPTIKGADAKETREQPPTQFSEQEATDAAPQSGEVALERLWDVNSTVSLPVRGSVDFVRNIEPVIAAGETFGASLRVNDNDGNLLTSFNDALYFSVFTLENHEGSELLEPADASVFTGSTFVMAQEGATGFCTKQLNSSSQHPLSRWKSNNRHSLCLQPHVFPTESNMLCTHHLSNDAGSASVSNWRILKTGLYKVKATCDSCLSAVSRPVRVVCGEPFSLRLIQQPGNSHSGAPLSVNPVVEATDIFGNVIVDLAGHVHVNLLPGRLSASAARSVDEPSVMGVLTRPFNDGRAAFPNLVIAAAGVGHQLKFVLLSPTTGSPIEVVSEPFKVEASEPAELVFLQHPPADVGAGAAFSVTVQLVDAHGNAVPERHTIRLSLWESNSLASAILGTTAAVSDISSGIAVFEDIAFLSSEAPLLLQAECTTCTTRVTGSSHSSVWNTSLVITTACNLLVEGSNEGDDECSVTVSLETLVQRWPTAPVTVKVSHIESIAMHSAGRTPALTIEPETLHFSPTDGPSNQKILIKAVDDALLQYSADVSDAESRLFIQHYRVHLQAKSEDPLWDAGAIEWVDEPFITVKVLDNDRKLLHFLFEEEPMLLRRGDVVFYDVSLGFSPIKGPIDVTLEAPVGITAEPLTMEFDSENWNIAQRMAPGSPSLGVVPSKFVITHILRGHSVLSRASEKEELIFFVGEDAVGRVLWDDTTRAVLAGDSLALPFSLSIQPIESVSVTLNCGPLLEPLISNSFTLTPLQWRKGAVFRLKAKDDGEAGKQTSLETCEVITESGDNRFTSNSGTNHASQEVGDYGLAILIFKQHCADGTYRAQCPCYSGQQCKLSRYSHCPAGTYRLPGTSACLQCLEGHFCVEGSSSAEPCPQGSTSKAGEATCHLCPIGSPCAARQSTACPAGHYAASGACIVCPEGFFCPVHGLAEPQPCPTGTYSFQGSVSCIRCPQGSFCPTSKLSDMSVCPSGTYSDAGSISCTPCPAGVKCLGHSGTQLFLPCNPGEYSKEASYPDVKQVSLICP